MVKKMSNRYIFSMISFDSDRFLGGGLVKHEIGYVLIRVPVRRYSKWTVKGLYSFDPDGDVVEGYVADTTCQ